MLSDPDLISLQEVRTKVEQAYSAWTSYRDFSQERVDGIVEAVASAARGQAEWLAKLAVEETGYGNATDKLTKNLLAADLLPKKMRGMRTVGVLRELPDEGLVEFGVSMGVVAAILPVTNPTSTAIYKTLIALKSGNAVVLSPHPRARRCSCETAALLAGAAENAGAPAGLVGCIGNSTQEATTELMRHRRTAVILSTGGAGIVRAAYSSGKPAYGVGPGNVPVVVDVSADVGQAVAGIIQGKTFDFGTLCSSEQTLVAERGLREKILAELKARRAHLCSAEEIVKLEHTLFGKGWSLHPECVGQAATVIARRAGIEVPEDTTVLAAEIGGIGKEHPLSAEKLSPVLSLYFVDGFEAALDACEAILRFGGLGHTCGFWGSDDGRAREYARRMPAYRVVVNTPTPLGSTGITTNVFPAMTLGCGAVAGNSTSDNISPLHLINVKRLAYGGGRMKPLPPLPDGRGSVTDPSGDRPNRAEVIAAVERYLTKHRTPTETPKAPPPAVPIVDFVCEDDVRLALKESRKITIGPKTIVTPSARDLAGPHDILVVTR
jgi:acetaldehyde dehydrogenase (acetylating)